MNFMFKVVMMGVVIMGPMRWLVAEIANQPAIQEVMHTEHPKPHEGGGCFQEVATSWLPLIN